jgi:hypothetical protein
MKLCRPFRLALARCFSRQFAVRFFHLMLNLRSSKYAASPPSLEASCPISLLVLSVCRAKASDQKL